MQIEGLSAERGGLAAHFESSGAGHLSERGHGHVDQVRQSLPQERSLDLIGKNSAIAAVDGTKLLGFGMHRHSAGSAHLNADEIARISKTTRRKSSMPA